MGESRRALRYERKVGGVSDGCALSRRSDHAMVRPSRRGGVPVLSRASGRPSRSRVAATPTLAPSTSRAPSSPCAVARAKRPAARRVRPISISPRKKVPVVSTTQRARSEMPSAVITPCTAPSSTIRSSTEASTSCRRSTRASVACMVVR
eukprot:scaffold45881_cov37-Tisochrysis_lutea.AAC.1